VAIYGLGLIGGSIALAIKRRWASVAVTAIDRPHVVASALRMGIADDGGESVAAAAGADLVMLAAPVLQNAAVVRELPRLLTAPVVVTDAGSTKRAMMEAAATLPAHIQFIGGHPLSGAAISGLEAARPDLFDDRPWILTPPAAAPAPSIGLLAQFVSGLRAVPHQMAADEHDRLLAYISHLPQLAVSALMHVVGVHAREEGLVLAGRGLRDTTRLASSSASTWRDIVGTNGDNVSAAIDDLIAALEQLKASHSPVSREFDDIFTSANRWKGVLEHG
jgi:prephenate dehydrogenase